MFDLVIISLLVLRTSAPTVFTGPAGVFLVLVRISFVFLGISTQTVVAAPVGVLLVLVGIAFSFLGISAPTYRKHLLRKQLITRLVTVYQMHERSIHSVLFIIPPRSI